MNEVVQTMLNHRSIRQYTNEPIKSADVDIIIKAAQAAPSSINGQQVTIIAVQDEMKKAKLAELCGNQAWIDQAPIFLIFCADFYRSKLAAEKMNKDQIITESIESVIVGATDVGIAMSNAITAAESLKLGTVPIGGVRNQPHELIELLNIPNYVFPVCGLVIGHSADPSDIKPRFPKEAVYHEEAYNKNLRSFLDQYDETISEYMKQRTDNEQNHGWSEMVTFWYEKSYYPEVYSMLLKQGFSMKEESNKKKMK
ncbi:hypothetical protein IKE_06261 [Bacillus cereus VD196]|uniref:Nitroreductase domain-containing protein n=1 Tax=Bacillus cereus VD196 TaxID=1053243 RepID=A0A9W5PXQ2_BACCE|nr:NADPH-dependent oxidoreductase [Bacillus cereus]EJR91177.1 hypothetical protein IKG_05750 [Bacillus cereus VD200]EOO58576.1 hypothetical protein IKE_06261 [Bacillus cereus VD196]